MRANPNYDAVLEARRQAYIADRLRRSRGEAPPQQPAQPAAEPAAQQQQQPQLIANPELHVHVPRPDDRPPLERMGDNLEEAFRDENDSRVAQSRENRRMGFARDMEAMRQEGLLKRLQAMNDSQYDRPDAPSQQGGGIGVFNPNTRQFEYGSRLVTEDGVKYLDGRRLF
jgi:hypothetical protein